jgi:hypothetical protein
MSPKANRIAEFLESRIRAKGMNGIIYYNQIARQFRMPRVTEAWYRHPLSGIFDEIDNDDHKKDKPFKTAIVISERKKYPGDGFFKMVLKLRYPNKAKFTENEKMKIYSDELVALEKMYKS